MTEPSRSGAHESGGLAAATFTDRVQAERALRELRDNGFPPAQIGVVTRDAGEARDLAQTAIETREGEGAAIGVVAGGALGGAAGWLIGVGALFLPGIGPVVAAGPLAAAIGAAVLGAAAGGLVGALVGEGIPEETTRWYEREVRSGAALITVRAGARRAEAAEILHRQGGVAAPEAGSVDRTPADVARYLAGAWGSSYSGAVVGGVGEPIHPRSELVAEPPDVTATGGSSAGPGEPPASQRADPSPAYAGPMPAPFRQTPTEAETIQPGWRVYCSDGDYLGVVREVTFGRLRVDRGPAAGTVDVPPSAVRRAEQNEVYLDVPGSQIDAQGWPQTRPPANQT